MSSAPWLSPLASPAIRKIRRVGGAESVEGVVCIGAAAAFFFLAEEAVLGEVGIRKILGKFQ